jgi:large subunit ribosomal protein L5e
MAFIKVIKNTAYFKRFQVKFRRRREGKTDYYQRKRLIIQRKNKYNTPKWRFVVRRTSSKIECKVVWSTIVGDRVKVEANSQELRRYGLTAGLTNYSASYCTGLLCAKRLLKVLDAENAAKGVKTSLLTTYDLVKEADGKYVNIEEERTKKGIELRPFTCFLDLGLVRATVGNRVFGAVKGAIDGGLNIPCNEKIFPKVKEVKGKAVAGASANPHRDRIYGVHVSNYMEILKKSSDKNAYNKQFRVWEECLKANKAAKLEDLYKKIHAEIRKNPDRVKNTKPRTKRLTKEEKFKRRDSPNVHVGHGNKKFRRDRKITIAARKQRVVDKITAWAKARQQKK